MNDNKLLVLIKSGNSLAFKQLFSTYYGPLCLYLTNFTNDKDLSEDIVQLVFIDFWNKRETIEIHTSIKNYLYKMTYRQFLMDLRKKKKEANVLDSLKHEILYQTETTRTEEELNNKINRLQHIISKLPNKCQEIIKLKMEGLKYREIADTLDISVKTVESQIRIAFKKIKKDFKDDLILFFSFFKRIKKAMY